MTQDKPIEQTLQDLKTKIGQAIVERIEQGVLNGVTSENGVSLLANNKDAHIAAAVLLFKVELKLNKDGQTGYLVFEKLPVDLTKNLVLLRTCTKNQKTNLLDDYERVNTDYLTDFGWQIVEYVPLFIIKKHRFLKDKLLLGTLIPKDQYDSLATSVKQAKANYVVSQTLPSELLLDPKNKTTKYLEAKPLLKSLEAKTVNLKDFSRTLPDIVYKDYNPTDDPNALSIFLDFHETLVKGYETELLDLQNKMLKVLETCGRDIVINL